MARVVGMVEVVTVAAEIVVGLLRVAEVVGVVGLVGVTRISVAVVVGVVVEAVAGSEK